MKPNRGPTIPVDASKLPVARGCDISPKTTRRRTRRDPLLRDGSDRREAQRLPIAGTAERIQQTYDIIEGTERIQQLVIARAVGGLRIE